MSEVRSVLDLPIWTDCPWRNKVPAEIEIRRGTVYADQGEVVSFWWPKQQLHVDVVADETVIGIDGAERVVPPMLSNLAGAVFDREYPDMYMTCVKLRHGVPLIDPIPHPEKLKEVFNRFEELEKFKKFIA